MQKGQQIFEGRKNLIFVINRNIYIINVLKELNLRLITTKLTLHYTKALLNSDKETYGDGEDYDKSINQIDELIDQIDGQLYYFAPTQSNYGQLDVANARILGELVEILLQHNILRMDFQKMNMSELMGDPEKKD